MVFASFCVLAGLLLVSPVSPARLSVTIGKSLTLPCSGGPSRHVEWYFQQKDHTVRLLVAKFHNGTFIPGTDFENRVNSFHLEMEGNYSLILSPVYSDHGIYKCQYNDENLLSDVKLDIIVPSVISIPMGMSASLPCFGNIDKRAPAVDLDIHWKRDGLTVYQRYKNNITYGPGFENRVSLSTEHALQGNMSLTIRQTLFSDQGDYQCFYNSPKERGNPDSASLTVTEHPAQNLTVKASGLLSIPLHTTDPVRVTFSAGLGLEEVLLLPADTGPAKYGERCDQRCEVQDYTLLVRSVTLEDAGVYKVTDPETNKIISRVYLQVSDTPLSGGAMAGIVVGALVLLLLEAAAAGIGFAIWKCPKKTTRHDDGIRYQAACAEDQNDYNSKTKDLLVPGSPEPHLSVSETQPAPPEKTSGGVVPI